MMPLELIHKNIDRILAEKNWKACDLARAMGVSDSHVSQIRTGKRWGKRMEWETYCKVCDALGVGELELIKPFACANEEIFKELVQGMAGLEDNDVALIYQFLAILKNRKILNPKHFEVLSGTMSMLQEELIRKRGPEAALTTPMKSKRGEYENIEFEQN